MNYIIIGKFGKVYRGELRKGHSCNEIAIKTTRSLLNFFVSFICSSYVILDLSLSEAAELMEECNIAKKFDHPNVLSLLGISFTPEEDKPLMVMPYMHHGDVKSYLKSKRGGLIEIKEFPQVDTNYIAWPVWLFVSCN